MTTARCPACHAAVPVGAQWCGLCFADLRPKPVEPAPTPMTAAPAVAAPAAASAAAAASAVPAAGPAAASTPAAGPALAVAPAYDPLTSPLPPPPSVPESSPSALDAPVMKAADLRLAAPSWPCAACGATVPIEADTCGVCGAGFLGGSAAAISLELPVVGDVARLSGGQKWVFAGVAATVLSGVIWLLMLVFGSFL